MTDPEPFATTNDLALFLEDDDLKDSTRAALLLDLASGLIRDDTGQRINRVEDDVIVVDGGGGALALIVLPELPVTAVTLVETLDDDDVATTVATTGYRVDLDAGTIRLSTPARRVRVTYTHGHATAPSAAKTVALRVTARAVYNPVGIRQELAGSMQTNAGDSAGLYLSPNDRRTLDALRPGKRAR